MLNVYQGFAINAALASVDRVLDEQGIATEAAGEVDPDALRTGVVASATMLDRAPTDDAFDRIVETFLADAARDAIGVSTAVRPAVHGYVRAITTPCCGRCAVLAGRFYRWNAGFQRHPRCDCMNVPTTESGSRALATNPDEIFRAGQIKGLSRADTKALNAGADLGRVVNVRRKGAGLVEGSSVMVRGDRPTPAYIFRVASDRADAVSMLSRFGYIT